MIINIKILENTMKIDILFEFIMKRNNCVYGKNVVKFVLILIVCPVIF